MSSSDFDPTMIGSSSEEILPQKRSKKAEDIASDLPDPLELLKNFRAIEREMPKKKTVKKIIYENSVISKPAVINNSTADDIEQYDYFANESTAILDN